MIDINKTKLSESNYSEFMETLDSEIVRQCPTQVTTQHKYSYWISKEQWLLDEHGSTVQSIVDSVKGLAE
jgi:hypothetical protein